MAEKLQVSTREGVASLEGSEAHRSIPSGPQAALLLPSSPGSPSDLAKFEPSLGPSHGQLCPNPHRFPAVLVPPCAMHAPHEAHGTSGGAHPPARRDAASRTELPPQMRLLRRCPGRPLPNTLALLYGRPFSTDKPLQKRGGI